MDGEDDYPGGIETDENIEDTLKEASANDVLAIREEEKGAEEPDKTVYEGGEDDKRGYEVEDDDKREYEVEKDDRKDHEVTTEASLRRLDRTSRKFSFAPDIEEVDEEMEEYEISISDGFQRPDSEGEMQKTRDEERYTTGTRLTLARSRIIDRAASVLEQRLKMISGLKQLYEERIKLALKNRFLNKKCCEFIKKTTTVDLFESAEGSLPIHENQR